MHESQKSTTTDAARDPLRRAAKRAVARLRRGRADESGLTTLEWLLIVAAVAGLAALAVVLVQNVVDDTAEQIGGNSARGTAARVAAERITREARAALPTSGDDDNTGIWTLNDADDATAIVAKQSGVNTEYGAACDRLEINYGDAGVTSDWLSAVPGTQTMKTFAATVHGSTSVYDSKGNAWGDATVLEADFEAYCKVSIPEN